VFVNSIDIVNCICCESIITIRRVEGRKERRKEGRKEGRKKGKKERKKSG